MLAALAPAAKAADNPVDLGLESLQTLGDLLGGRRDIELIPASQSQFDRLSGDLMAAVDPRSAGTGLPLGHGRWSVSVSGDRSATDDPSLWALASDRARSELLAPRLALAVGIGSRLNLELAGMRLPGSSVRLMNVAASVSLLGADADSPAHLALRASFGRLRGIEDVRVNTAGLELLASRRYGWLTAYAGAGAVFGRGQYAGDIAFR